VADQEVLDRLDRLVGIVALAFDKEIAAARASLRKDPVHAAALDLLDGTGWLSATYLRASVAKTSGQSEGTVARKMARLVDLGFLESAGATTNLKYRSRGIV
jgi:hypothetical protein